jgi:hypothetical protein
MEALASLEKQLASLAPADGRGAVVDPNLDKLLASNGWRRPSRSHEEPLTELSDVVTTVHQPLIHLLERNISVLWSLSESSSAAMVRALLDETGVQLNILQGLCMLSMLEDVHECVQALGQAWVIEVSDGGSCSISSGPIDF